jgi:hypothetical protein
MKAVVGNARCIELAEFKSKILHIVNILDFYLDFYYSVAFLNA